MKLRDLTFIYHTSVKKVAKKMGVSEMSIYQLCYAKYPTYDKIKKTAEAIGCQPCELEEVIRDGRKKLEEKNKNNFATFKELLKAQNKTQYGLSKFLKVSPQRANQLLTQMHASEKNIKKLAQFFEMSEDEIRKIYLKKS